LFSFNKFCVYVIYIIYIPREGGIGQEDKEGEAEGEGQGVQASTPQPQYPPWVHRPGEEVERNERGRRRGERGEPRLSRRMRL